MLTNLSVSIGTRRAARPSGLSRRFDGFTPHRRPVAPCFLYRVGAVPELAGILTAALAFILQRTGGSR